MSRFKTRVAAVLACVLVSIGVVAVPATPALAACYASSCTGLDPNNQGCSPDATTWDEFTFGARFELRVSIACWAAWTRVTSPTHYNTIFGQIRSNNGKVYGVQATEGQHWTKMINFDNLVRSCRSGWFDGDPIECTAWH
jgi:hypothetical protein